MFGIVFIGIFISIMLFGIISVLIRRNQYEAELGFLLIVIIYFLLEVIFFITFNLSTERFFNISIAKNIFKVSILCRVLSMSLWSASHSSELFKNFKFRFIPLMIYLFLFGIISSLISVSNSIELMVLGESYIFIFNSIPLLVSIILFYTILIFILFTTQIKGYNKFSDKDLAQFNNYYILILSLNIIHYMVYLINMNEIVRITNLSFYIIGFSFIVYIIIRKPSLFLVYTNRIYDLIIFHKSGILLYSYNFQTKQEVEEKSLKGSILIGISHVMANISSIENQLAQIKMKDKAIIFHFDKELGFAVLLIAKHKNQILEKSVNLFIEEFSQQHKDSLKNLKGLIDISRFDNTIQFIKKSFKHYIPN